MSIPDAPQPKDFTAVESDFLDAGVEMDRAASAEVAGGQGITEAPPSPWARLGSAAFGRWGAVLLVGTGVFLLGGASLRANRGAPVAAASLTSLTVATSSGLAAAPPPHSDLEAEPTLDVAAESPLASADPLVLPPDESFAVEPAASKHTPAKRPEGRARKAGTRAQRRR